MDTIFIKMKITRLFKILISYYDGASNLYQDKMTFPK